MLAALAMLGGGALLAGCQPGVTPSGGGGTVVSPPSGPAGTSPGTTATAGASPTRTPPATTTVTPVGTTAPPAPATSVAATVPATPAAWPTPTGDVSSRTTIKVSGTFDGQLRRYSGVGDGGQSEDQPALFEVANGGTVQNVVIGAPAGDGIHCLGTCTLRNVWWEDVGEDAATFKGTSATQTMTIDGGGARHASDKVFQHNGPGTMVIRNFQVADFGKLYRSCGNCSAQYRRAVVIQNVTVTAPGKTLAGINSNYGDTATLSGITIVGDAKKKISICDRYEGNDAGDEPVKLGTGADGTYCRYTPSDLTYR
ncbi:pectate lyase [Pseudofrankia saprophytica]|uniref:pectate lyase n=1 Tax=Pseudofrankia saprophytica TaxID=298655 RepID=UPI000234B962|nr:pectate lyase [Pseudofrankia saprophytica]